MLLEEQIHRLLVRGEGQLFGRPSDAALGDLAIRDEGREVILEDGLRHPEDYDLPEAIGAVPDVDGLDGFPPIDAEVELLVALASNTAAPVLELEVATGHGALADSRGYGTPAQENAHSTISADDGLNQRPHGERVDEGDLPTAGLFARARALDGLEDGRFRELGSAELTLPGQLVLRDRGLTHVFHVTADLAGGGAGVSHFVTLLRCFIVFRFALMLSKYA